jgi:hypothetical protein
VLMQCASAHHAHQRESAFPKASSSTRTVAESDTSGVKKLASWVWATTCPEIKVKTQTPTKRAGRLGFVTFIARLSVVLGGVFEFLHSPSKALHELGNFAASKQQEHNEKD